MRGLSDVKSNNKTNIEIQLPDKEKEEFVTIDDLISLGETLYSGLVKLGEYRHPLKVRKGGLKEVVPLSEKNEESRTLKAGKKTYFFDIKYTKGGKPYLMITESWFKTEEEQSEPERNNIIVFPEQALEFSFITTLMLATIVDG